VFFIFKLLSRRRKTLKVLVVGNGAREHALIWKLAQSAKITQLFCAPGNAGTALLSTNLSIKPTDITALVAAVKDMGIQLVVVGPEAPLAEGIVDYFKKIGIPVFGPTQGAAQIEASKAFSKALFQKYGIPCAFSRTFSELTAAKDYVKQQGSPLVIKADGLAAGKGVIMAETLEEALQAVSSIMESKTFDSAGEKVVIEEKLTGKEMSFFAITDGKTVLPTVPACDYKRIKDGDLGPNTGGMGSYSPPYFYTPELGTQIISKIIEPTIRAMATENRPYQGVLYAGLMINNGEPKLLEYNARFGDPECQIIMPRLKSDLLDIILATVEGKLESVQPDWTSEACVGVVMASGGYPGNYKTGLPISGLDEVDKDVMVFHAGTKIGNKPGEVLTNGGRVLTVAATGKTTEEARNKIYSNLPRIHFEGAQYRRDIAKF
jgi:phosphoribosylamine--glycine ligase